MRQALLVTFALVLPACAGVGGVTRLHDGNYRVACEGRLLPCLEPAARVCAEHGYDIVRAEERRELQGASPYAAESLKSVAVVRCHQPKPLFGAEPSPPKPVASPPPARPSAPSPPRCVPGTSITCATATGCQGAQVCAPDGASFGACTCEPPPAPPAEPATSVPGAPGTPP